ncbi:MAG: helix-turn-helix domain-containing protein [Campylobacterota bacterium]|nr:helix-turn-helix domain-containing protein [Campylobacterota bacterium]
MITFDDVMLRIKQIIAANKEKQRIYNKEIAQALGLTPEYFAVIKKRGKIPYEAIATFCRNRKISINWVLFGQEPKKL